MLPADIDAARQALRDQVPAELIGLPECEWLEVKSGVYQLDKPAHVAELVKDVAALANSDAGGLLLVGLRTRAEHGEDIIEAVNPVPRKLVDVDRHRKIIRDHVIPAPRNLRMDWLDCGSDTGILVIDVPPQPLTSRPYVVPDLTGAQPGTRSIAVPLRDGNSTYWLPQQQLYRLLAAGWATTPNAQLRSLVTQAVKDAQRQERPAPSSPAFQAGQGATPPLARRLAKLCQAKAGRVGLGSAEGEVYAAGPGAVQHFDGSGGPHPWVLTALADREPVLVAEPVWVALEYAGSAVPGGDAIAAVGLPILGDDVPLADRVIDQHTASVELAGGDWGPGLLVRDTGKPWRRKPVPRFSHEITRASRNWTTDVRNPQLRLRAVATLPVADASDLAITANARRRLLQQLPYSDLAGAVTVLSRRQGANLPAARWQPNQEWPQSPATASFTCQIAAPDGPLAMIADVMMALPNAADSSLVTCAELRIDMNAWHEALQAEVPHQTVVPDQRLTVPDIHAFLQAAWMTAMELLPGAVLADPPAARLMAPPQVELRITAERPLGQPTAEQLQLTDLLDLSAFGTSDRVGLPAMSVTVTAPVRLSAEDRTALSRRALVVMAQGFGFIEATEDAL